MKPEYISYADFNNGTFSSLSAEQIAMLYNKLFKADIQNAYEGNIKTALWDYETNLENAENDKNGLSPTEYAEQNAIDPEFLLLALYHRKKADDTMHKLN